MKDEQTMCEKLADEIIKLFADNKISYSEAGDVMYCAKKKMDNQFVQSY